MVPLFMYPKQRTDASRVLHLYCCVVPLTRHPDICPIECNAQRWVAYGEYPKNCPVTCAQLNDLTAGLSCRKPDVDPVESNAAGFTSYSECSHIGAIASTKLGDCAVPIVCDPHIRSVESDTGRATTYRECSEIGPITGTKLDDVADSIGHPNVGAIEGNTVSCGADAEGSQVSAIARAQLGDVASIKVGHPDIAAVESNTTERANAHSESAQDHAIAAAYLGHNAWAGAGVRHPDVGSVIGYAMKAAEAANVEQV